MPDQRVVKELYNFKKQLIADVYFHYVSRIGGNEEAKTVICLINKALEDYITPEVKK